MAAPLKFKSEVKIWTAGSGSFVQFNNGFINQPGPNGGRVVIDGISMHASFVITVAGAALLGTNKPRFFRSVFVKQKDGAVRVNDVPGDCLRTALYELIGAEKVKDHGDTAIGAGQTISVTLYVPFKKRFSHEEDDYSMAAELLEQVRINCAQDGDFTLGASTVTITSGTYWLVAECHEEMDVVQHAVDELRTQPFESTASTEARLVTNGRLQDLLLMVRGDNGGADLATLSEAWIAAPLNVAPQLLLTPDLQEHYARERNQVTGSAATQGAPLRSDPFVTSTVRAAAVLLNTSTKAFEQPEREFVNVKTTQTGGGPGLITMIARIAKPRSEETQKAIAKKYGLRGKYRVKTASNTMRHPDAWKDEHLRYMPIKFTA